MWEWVVSGVWPPLHVARLDDSSLIWLLNCNPRIVPLNMNEWVAQTHSISGRPDCICPLTLFGYFSLGAGFMFCQRVAKIKGRSQQFGKSEKNAPYYVTI